MPIRGVKNPVPMSGDKPTGIFSTSGSQKKDPLSASQSKNSSMIGSAQMGGNRKPVKKTGFK
jgi:hypothetical protein